MESNITNIDRITEAQKKYFLSGATLPVSFRKEMLKKLYSSVKKYESDIENALFEDLGKSGFESFMCEIGMVYSEISYMIKHIGKFAKEKRVKTPMAQFASKSFKAPNPYGNVLIMSPWNYPFLLTVGPMIDAIAAGNTMMVKPSAYSPATSSVLKKLVTETFPYEYIAIIEGGRRENAELLNKKFDFVFFTGSQAVGKEALRHTTEHLTPAVLELGGKSPCIVDSSAKIALAARRIVFGKYLNCGQTCVAPDYILCDVSVKDELLREIEKEIKKQYGEAPLQNSDYGKIINQKHFDRILSLIDSGKTVIGGGYDAGKMKIEPTVMKDVEWSDAVMQEEIFGPVLPILTFEKFEEIYSLLADKPKPLALYLFTEDRVRMKEVTQKCRYGGGCINDCIIHLATSEMGFGGVGESGMGAYHGRAGFNTFSHTKSIVWKKTWIDMSMRYQPYTEKNKKTIKFFLK